MKNTVITVVFPDRCTVYVSFPLNSFTQGLKVLSSLSLTVFYITIWVFTTQIFSSGFVNFKKTNKISTLAVSCFTDSFLTREVSAVRVFIGCECVSVWEHWCRHMTRACL